MKTRVVLADDHAFIRIGIRNILNQTIDIMVIGEAADGAQALALAEELKPDVLILDMEMPRMKGIEVAHKLKERGTQIPILALSAHEDRHFILGMLSNGASGYLTKEEVPEVVVSAVRGVALGEQSWISRKVAARIGIWMYRKKRLDIPLRSQDAKLFSLILAGKKVDEIGALLELNAGVVEQRLSAAVQTVREHLEKVYR